MKPILVVDDEPQIRRSMRTSLEAHGYRVETASNGEEALAKLVDVAPDLVFLDLGLPDLDGTEVIRRLRSFSDAPVIVLSVRDAQSDKVAALDAGADDYVTKPFGVEEILARMRAQLRRVHAGQPAPAVRRIDDVEIDLARRLVRLDGSPVHLTRTEWALLEAFVTNPGKLLTHGWLLRTVWGQGYGDESHYLRVYVRSLRKKLGDEASSPRLILTEPGIGYRWVAEDGH
jgi:two-component system, OmpR family, KDP operon response regulator KdpE